MRLRKARLSVPSLGQVLDAHEETSESIVCLKLWLREHQSSYNWICDDVIVTFPARLPAGGEIVSQPKR
jgi:hypothetical protein